MTDLTQSLKTHNLKLTAARKIVFEALSQSSRALSPKELFEQVAKKTDLVSIYRNLSLFADIGVAHRFQDGRYSLCEHEHEESDGHRHIHIMMNCLGCGLTKEIREHSKELCSIASQLKEYSQPLIDVESLVLQGQCNDCLQKREAPQ